jgi:hypothetical protein
MRLVRVVAKRCKIPGLTGPLNIDFLRRRRASVRGGVFQMVRERDLKADREAAGSWLTRPWSVSLSTETCTWLAVAVGILLRIMEYSDNRQLYMDEKSLLENVAGRPVFDFHTVLTEEQLAPPGFLVIERLMVRLPIDVKLAGRLAPFLCGIVSMILFRQVARRYLSRRAAPIAVGLFALADWVLYYSVEMKQYSSDMALTLAALSMAAGPNSSRWRLALAGFGAVGVWFSYPLALVLAAVGTYLIGEAASRREWKTSLAFVGMSVVWASSFAICYKVSHRILSKGRFIWDWWDFAFLPLPPQSIAALKREIWQLVNVTNNPASVFTPIGVVPSAILATGLFALGALAMGRRWRGGLYLLLAPIFFVFVASSLRQYPFHGRLLLFVVPAIHLLIGEGAAALTSRGGPFLTWILGAFLLSQPAYEACWHRLVQERARPYDSHGDLRHDLLDHLDQLESRKKWPDGPGARP